MANLRTMPSRYGGGMITPAQYVTEFICEKKAGRELPEKFWSLPEWSKYFRNQIPAANALLKIYSVKAILRAINDPRCKKIYSLRSPLLDKIIGEKEAEIKAEQEKEFSLEVQEDKQFIPNKSKTAKKSILSQLKELDE